MPRHMRHHVAAVYAFARIADDMADEGELSADKGGGAMYIYEVLWGK